MIALPYTINAASTLSSDRPQPVPAARTVSAKTWLAVVGATLGAFMAVLNIQIVNASLADIQGAIGAGIDDGGWISTSYLIAEIVVIPFSGWLAQVFSVRIYLLTNAVLFLALSAACALAQDLPQMIALRAVQGFTGGVLIPMAFTLIITLLPKAKQPIGLALFALSATFAPAIGPTIGGYLTENWGWEYIFYVNLVPGAVMVGMLYYALEAKPMNLSLLREGDWAGIVTMAIGLSALQTVLEEGNKDDWFGSPFIVKLSVIAAVALTAFLWIELTAKKPLLNLRLLFRRNFGFGILADFLLGVALYGSVFILPVYLSRIQGYNAEQIGMVLAWTGLPQLLLILLTKREQYHSNVLMQSVSLLEQATRARIEKLTQYFVNHGIVDHADATHRAVVAIGKIVQKQAFILAFSDTFYLLGAALIVALIAALLLKKPSMLAGGGAH